MIAARYASLVAFAQSRGFCPTGDGGGIDNSCSGSGKGSDYDPGHFDVGPDPNGLTEKDLMYSPTVKWTQDHKSLVRDAVKSWKGSPTDMTLHVMSELKGDGTPGSGSGKIMRAQATALLAEVLDNGEPAPTLYRGASIPPEQDPSPLLGWTSKKSVAEAFAKKNNGEVYTLEGATGLDTSKIKAHGMGEAEWIVPHKIPYGYQVYHGTNADDPESLDFNEVSKSTNSTDLGDYDTTRHGVFFSDSKAFASEYGKNVGKFSLDLEFVADLTTQASGDHSRVVDQFLKSLDATGKDRAVYITALYSNPWKPWLMFEGDVGEKFVSWLKDEGYDAARFKEYTGNDVGGNTTVVFDKKKIKPKKEGRAYCPNGTGGGVTNTCGKGIGINDADQDFTGQILAGEKTIETRRPNSLKPYIGKTVGIVRTGKGKATLVGTMKIGEPKFYKTRKEFDADFDKHRVGKDSGHYIGPEGKYGYPLTEVKPVKPRVLKSTGYVARVIAKKVKTRDLVVEFDLDAESPEEPNTEPRSADCGREDDGKFSSGNKCAGSVDMPKEDPKGRMRYDNGVQTDAARKLYQMGSSEKRLKALVDVMGGDPKNTRVDINPPSLNISVADKDGNKLFHVDFENGRARLYPAKDLNPAEASKIKEAAGEAFGGRQADTTIKVFSKAEDMKKWEKENATKIKKWEDKYAFSTLLPPHQRPKKWERSIDAKHASLLAFVQSRGFCPNGEGNGVTNNCSSKESSAPEPEADEPPPALHLLAERDAEAPQTKIKSGDGEVTVVDRTGISTPDYLDEIECHGRDCGLEVTFEEAKRLQPDSDIKDDWSPLDAYVGPGSGYFTGYDGSLGENADSSIDYHGGDYGTIDDYMASDLLAEKQKEVEKEWDEMSDDEKNVASMKLLYGKDESPTDSEDVVALRFAGKKQWMEDNTADIEESINAMREDARSNAVAVMSKQLISAVAADTIECCLQLYRGLRVDPAEVDRMISSGYVVHENVNSWTTSRDVSRSFGASRLLLVTRKPRVGHIFSSNAHSEMEVVRPPSRMRILGVVRTSTGTVLHVDEDEDYKEA